MNTKFNLKNQIIQTGLVALICGATILDCKVIKNMFNYIKEYEYTADFIGDRDGYTTDEEKLALDHLIDYALKRKAKNAYQAFVIDDHGKMHSINVIAAGDTIPYIDTESLGISEYPGITQGELTSRMNAGKQLPESREWTATDYFNRFGLFEINQNGVITGTYILTNNGMKKL